MFPELVSQEGKVGVELLTVVTGLPHQGPGGWRQDRALARDLLEDLSFVEQDRVGGVDVEEETGLVVLLDPSDGQLHSSGTGKYWCSGPGQGNQGPLVDIHGSDTNTGARHWDEGRRRRRRRETLDVDIASRGRDSLEPLLSGRDPDRVVDVHLLSVLQFGGGLAAAATAAVVVIFHQDRTRGIQLPSLVGAGGDRGGVTGFRSGSLGFTFLFLQKGLRDGIGRALELLQTPVEDSGVCGEMIVGAEMSLSVDQIVTLTQRQVSRQVNTGGHFWGDQLRTGGDILHLLRVLNSGDDFD